MILLLNRASQLSDAKDNASFDEDNIDGGWESVFVSCDEDYLIAMAYIATCLTLKRTYDYS